MKTFQHPETKAIRTVPNDADIQIAALKKLGYVAITAKDIENDPRLSVTYEQVTSAKQPIEPPALPRLTTPVPNAPTRDTDTPVSKTVSPVAAPEDVAPLTPAKGDK